jgi:hypothetical protein
MLVKKMLHDALGGCVIAPFVMRGQVFSELVRDIDHVASPSAILS